MRVKKVSTESIEEDWKRLEQQSKTASFFQSYDFHRIFLKHFPFEPTILVVEDGEEAIGIAPFVEKDGRYEFVVTQKVLESELVADYGDILAMEGWEQEVWDAIISFAKDQDNGLQLDFVRETSPTYTVLKTDDRKPTTDLIDVAPRIELPDTWDAYLESLQRHDRRELRRKMRKLDRDGVVSACDGNALDHDLVELYRLMRLSSAEKKEFLSVQMQQFFTDLITYFYNQGFVQLCFLSYRDQRIAALVSFVTDAEVLLYNGGFDPEFRQYSPGIVLNGHMIKHAIQKGIQAYDFLRGNERYKYNLGGLDQGLYQFLISN